MKVNSVASFKNINLIKNNNNKNAATIILNEQNHVSFGAFFDGIKKANNKAKLKSQALEIKKNAREVLVNSKKAQRKANEIQIRAKEPYSRASAIKNNAMSLGIEMRELYHLAVDERIRLPRVKVIRQRVNDKEKVYIESFDENGSLYAQARYENGEFQVRKHNHDDTTDLYIFDKDAKFSKEFLKNVRYSAVGLRADEKYVFDGRWNVQGVYKNYQSRYDNSFVSEEYFEFVKSRLSQYAKGYSSFKNATVEQDEHYKFGIDGILVDYIKNLKSEKGVYESKDEHYQYSSSGLYSWHLNDVHIEGGARTIQKDYTYQGEQLLVAELGYELTNEDIETVHKVFYFTKGNPKKVIIDRVIDRKKPAGVSERSSYKVVF